MDISKIENIESKALMVEESNIADKLTAYYDSFSSKIMSIDGCFSNISNITYAKLIDWCSSEKNSVEDGIDKQGISSSLLFGSVRDMFEGCTKTDGTKTLGLNEINTWKINPEYKYSNIKQHAGYAAEVISTTKENIWSGNNGTRVYRTDDLAGQKLTFIGQEVEFNKNDQYVDKVRCNANGEVIERIQTKFVGKNAEECLDILSSKKYEKYLDDSKVDKIEIPKDYYGDVKKGIEKKIAKLEKQLDHCEMNGKTEVVEKNQIKIDNLKKLDEKLERSNTTSTEAIQAVEHPQIYKAKMFAKEVVVDGLTEGVESAKVAAAITVGVSTVNNITKIYNNEIGVEEAVVNIVKDTGTSAVMGFVSGTLEGAATSLISNTLKSSGNEIIKAVGGSCMPGMAVSLAVESYDTVVDFINGDIDEYEFADNMGENVARVAGGAIGASLGCGVGSAVGAMVGAAAAATIYNASQEFIENYGDEIVDTVVGTATDLTTSFAEGTAELAEQAMNLATDTVDAVSEFASDRVDDVKDAFCSIGGKAQDLFSSIF